MCGRFVIKASLEQIQETFRVNGINAEINDNYNVAPTTKVLAVVQRDSTKWLESFIWGLIPIWTKPDQVKERAPGIWVAKSRPWINTTAERLSTQSNFKRFLRKRCLIPAWGYYEFRQIDKKTKVPYLFQLESRELFAFAGHWDVWKSPTDDVATCSIITTAPNDFVARLHNRMPVILDKKGQEIWMDPAVQDDEKLVSLL